MSQFRTIDGTGNNGDQGVTGSNLIRLFDNAFEDGISVPRGGEFYESTLPNPRTISNIVIDQVEPVTNFLNASDWLWQWAQLLDHDFALNEASGEEPNIPTEDDFTFIPVSEDDPTDPLSGTTIPFVRIPAVEGTGETTPRQINNQNTAFIDGSLGYGSNDEVAEFKRTSESGRALFAVSIADNGEENLVLNPLVEDENGELVPEFPNATGGILGDLQFLGGDIRANEQIGLTAAHTLLTREHNRVVLDIEERLEGGEDAALTEKYEEFLAENSGNFPEEELRDEFLYQSARKVLGASFQIISYNEFLPILIGDTLEEYSGFNPEVDPQVSVEFADAAFRVGHTLVSNQLLRVDNNGIIAEIPLADAFFNAEEVQANGSDTLLTGLIYQPAQEVDNQIVDALRTSLFPAGTGGLDLAAVNIARGRDVGIPGYTDVYSQIFPDAAPINQL